MWLPGLPDIDDHLRQGDLIDLQHLPVRGTITLTSDGLAADTKAGKAIVLEQCCSVENACTVLLARVSQVKVSADENDKYLRALRATKIEVGEPFAFTMHLLDPHPPQLKVATRKVWIARLNERVSIAAGDHDELADYRARRIARMTVLARAQFRAKLALHFARVEEKEDAVWLAKNGLDVTGQPLPE